MSEPKPKITEADYARAAEDLDCEVAAIKAVAKVEAGPYGAFLETGEPVILFERHIFARLTAGKWNVTHPHISNRRPGGYGVVKNQHTRLQDATKLDRPAALQSCSWGLFQVLGLNWKSLGYDSLQAFVNAMYSGEPAHLDSFVRYVRTNNLARHLKSHNWASFARGYNGPNYRAFQYDVKMQAAYEAANAQV